MSGETTPEMIVRFHELCNQLAKLYDVLRDDRSQLYWRFLDVHPAAKDELEACVYTVRNHSRVFNVGASPTEEFIGRYEVQMDGLSRLNRQLIGFVDFAYENGFAPESKKLIYDADEMTEEIAALSTSARQLTRTHLTMQRHFETIWSVHELKPVTRWLPEDEHFGFVAKKLAYDRMALLRDEYFRSPKLATLNQYLDEASVPRIELRVSSYSEVYIYHPEQAQLADLLLTDLIRDELVGETLET